MVQWCTIDDCLRPVNKFYTYVHTCTYTNLGGLTVTQHINYKHFLDCDTCEDGGMSTHGGISRMPQGTSERQRVPCRYKETGENAGLKAAMTASLAVQMSGISSLIGGTNPHQPLQCRQCQPTQHIKLPLP